MVLGMTDRWAATGFAEDLRWAARLLPPGSVGPAIVRVARALERVPRRSASGVRVERLGPISVRVHGAADRPGGTPRPAVLWVHGGGYVIGTAQQDDRVCAAIAEELDVVVAAVDYRRAPEHPFPVPLEDCHDALRWLAARPDVDPARIAIAGASAGGGLAAGLARLAVDRGEVLPVFQLLSYPMLDDRAVLRTELDEVDVRVWTRSSNRFGWTSYLGTAPGGDDVDPLAAPARQERLADLPPAWIGVGTLDLFHDEDLAYAARLEAAGVPCEVVTVPGAFHGFDSVLPSAPTSRRYVAQQLDALRAALA